MNHDTNLPVVHPDREPMTEAEARRVGIAAQQIAALRSALKGALSATLTVKSGNGFPVINLNQLSTEAVLSLLIEREALFLASFNVIPEPVA